MDEAIYILHRAAHALGIIVYGAVYLSLCGTIGLWIGDGQIILAVLACVGLAYLVSSAVHSIPASQKNGWFARVCAAAHLLSMAAGVYAGFRIVTLIWPF